MLGFSPISSSPFSAIIVPVGIRAKLPVEILATIRTVIEQVDMPIEILRIIKRDPKAQQWILKSRGKQWVVDAETLKWILNNRNKKWVLDENLTKWTFDSQAMKWIIK
jgi:hypothetical protein